MCSALPLISCSTLPSNHTNFSDFLTHDPTITLLSDTSFWADIGGSNLEDVEEIIRAFELHPLTIEDILW